MVADLPALSHLAPMSDNRQYVRLPGIASTHGNHVVGMQASAGLPLLSHPSMPHCVCQQGDTCVREAERAERAGAMPTVRCLSDPPESVGGRRTLQGMGLAPAVGVERCLSRLRRLCRGSEEEAVTGESPRSAYGSEGEAGI